MQKIASSPFADFEEICVYVSNKGEISMDRFGSLIKADEAEKIGLGLVQAAAVARERRRKLVSLKERSERKALTASA